MTLAVMARKTVRRLMKWQAFALIAVLLLVGSALIRLLTPESPAEKAERYYRMMSYHAEETKDVDAQKDLATQIVDLGSDAYPAVTARVRRGHFYREAVSPYEILRRMGDGANKYLSDEINRANRIDQSEIESHSHNSEIMYMIEAQIIAFREWRAFDLWLDLCKTGPKALQSHLDLMSDMLATRLHGVEYPPLAIRETSGLKRLNPAWSDWYMRNKHLIYSD